MPRWLVPPLVLVFGTAFFAVLAAVALDVFVHRPVQGGGSVTALLPGFVYAIATVMKVCLVSALVAAIIGSTKRASQGLPAWGIASIALPTSTPFIGTVFVLVIQGAVPAFPKVSRNAVFVMLAVIAAAVVAAVISLIRREQPRAVPVLGLVMNTILVGLFWYLRFYALSFDQDAWAPR